MILRHEIILSVVPYERKNVIYHEKNSKLTKINVFNDVVCNRIFFVIGSYKFFKNYWIFIKYGLFFGGNILYNSAVSNIDNK